MTVEHITEIAIVLDNPYHLPKWLDKSTKVYYKDGKPYGLIRCIENDGLMFIASTATHIDHPFTVGMIKDIRKMMKKQTVCLMSAEESKHEFLKEKLSRYGFEHYTEDGVLYMIGGDEDAKSV